MHAGLETITTAPTRLWLRPGDCFRGPCGSDALGFGAAAPILLAWSANGKSNVVRMARSIILGTLGAALGLFSGALIGGNWATSVELVGVRGYEAAGLLGLVVGAAAGLLGSAYWGARRL